MPHTNTVQKHNRSKPKTVKKKKLIKQGTSLAADRGSGGPGRRELLLRSEKAETGESKERRVWAGDEEEEGGYGTDMTDMVCPNPSRRSLERSTNSKGPKILFFVKKPMGFIHDVGIITFSNIWACQAHLCLGLSHQLTER